MARASVSIRADCEASGSEGRTRKIDRLLLFFANEKIPSVAIDLGGILLRDPCCWWNGSRRFDSWQMFRPLEKLETFLRLFFHPPLFHPPLFPPPPLPISLSLSLSLSLSPHFYPGWASSPFLIILWRLSFSPLSLLFLSSFSFLFQWISVWRRRSRWAWRSRPIALNHRHYRHRHYRRHRSN